MERNTTNKRTAVAICAAQCLACLLLLVQVGVTARNSAVNCIEGTALTPIDKEAQTLQLCGMLDPTKPAAISISPGIAALVPSANITSAMPINSQVCSNCTVNTPRQTGVDLNALAVTAALGGDVNPQSLAPSSGVEAACVRFLVAPAGRARGGARARRGVRRSRACAAFASTASRGTSSASCAAPPTAPGAVLATGDTPADALAHADRAAARIRFVTGRIEAVA